VYPVGRRARNVSDDIAKLPEGYTFGKPGEYGKWGTAECIGGFNIEDQQPDKDLGISKLKLSKKPLIPEQPADRVYGLPSLRTDKVEPKIKSVADKYNYGNEVGAQDTLYPGAYDDENVADSDFLEVKSARNIREIFVKIGVKLTDDEFNKLANQATKQYGGLSVDSFRSVYNQERYGF
jgi:hypothetical protein